MSKLNDKNYTSFAVEYARRFDGRTFQNFRPLLLSLVRLAQRKIKSMNAISPESVCQLPAKQIKDLQRYGKVAIKVYSMTKEEMEDENAVVGERLGVDTDSVLMVNNDGEEEDNIGMAPKFILYVDHEERNIVLAIRGTKSPKVKYTKFNIVAELLQHNCRTLPLMSLQPL